MKEKISILNFFHLNNIFNPFSDASQTPFLLLSLKLI